MAFTITAELPLGTYRGSGADGRPERLPSVARLYSALLSAAGFGPRARAVGDGLDISDEDAAALRWLEENAPDGVSIPALHVNRGGEAVAYRDDGTLRKHRSRKLAKTPDASVAVAGPFRWSWDDTPPRAVADALAALCSDVAHLGTTQSPVRLRAATTDDGDGTHRLDPSADLFTGATGEDLELPTAGRLDELRQTHVQGLVAPRLRSDAVGSDEGSTSPVPPRQRTALARYVATRHVRVDVPWPDVLLLPLDQHVHPRARVALAVAAHRALISAAAGRSREDGGHAPALVTGVHPAGRRPANGLALQVVDGGLLPDHLPAVAPCALALLVPRGAEPSDVAVLARAAESLTSLRIRGTGAVRINGRPVRVPGAELWPSARPGTVRLWRTLVPAVPETRGGGDGWTFRDAALLSLAYAWRDSLEPVGGRGQARASALVDRVARHARVLGARPLRTSDVTRYAHRTHEHAVVRPYRVELLLDEDFFGARTAQALGQSRHLGGGLLVPVDVPEDDLARVAVEEADR